MWSIVEGCWQAECCITARLWSLTPWCRERCTSDVFAKLLVVPAQPRTAGAGMVLATANTGRPGAWAVPELLLEVSNFGRELGDELGEVGQLATEGSLQLFVGLVSDGSGRNDGRDLREHFRRQMTNRLVELGEAAGDLGCLETAFQQGEPEKRFLGLERRSSESNRRSCTTVWSSHGER
ncbi:hypothetical protein E2C01_074017 [Portunus trituberculatus]|uniref:Uncharacterized protein n=1 Tax=Portunus trituberculatus TaxID=210409 RepID=A0A5B7IC85_PORTR|nr:hypothetical protein [Portunus trituberculatus]